MSSLLASALITSSSSPFQDPNADTEWNDILRKKGILPPKESLKELEEEEVEKEERLLQQSVGELAPLPLFCSIGSKPPAAVVAGLLGRSREAELERWHQGCAWWLDMAERQVSHLQPTVPVCVTST